MNRQESLVIVLVASMAIATFGCKNANPDQQVSQPDESQNSLSPAPEFEINQIEALVEKARSAREEQLRPFEEQSRLGTQEIYRKRAFQEAVAKQASQASLENVQKLIAELETYVGNPAQAPLRLTSGQFSLEQQLEIAKAVAGLLSIENENDRMQAIAESAEQADRLKKQQGEYSSSRNAELAHLRDTLDADNADSANIFLGLFRTRGTEEFGRYRYAETKASFWQSKYQYFFADENNRDEMIALQVGIQDESYNDTILSLDDNKRFEQFWVLAEGPRQLMLVSGRLEISVKTNAKLPENELYDVFRKFVIESNLDQLLQLYGASS